MNHFKKFNRRSSVLMFLIRLNIEEQNEYTVFFFFRSSTNILRTVFLLMPVISSNIRTLKIRSSAKHCWMTSVDSSVLEVKGQPLRSSSCNDSHPSLNLLCHSDTLDLYQRSPPYARFNNSNESVAVFFNFTQKLVAALCSILKPSTWRKS
jgi:hypothetical protein